LDRILLVASGTLPNIVRAVGRIIKVYPRARITVISRVPVLVTLRHVENVKELAVAGGLIVRIWRYWQYLLETRRTKYDEIFMLATNEGFLPLKLFGLACKGRSKFWVNEMGDWFNVMNVKVSFVHLRWRFTRFERSLKFGLKAMILSPFLFPKLLWSTCKWNFLRSQNLRHAKRSTHG